MGDISLHEVLRALSAPVPSPAAASAAAASAATGASLLVMAAEATARRLPEGQEKTAVAEMGAKAGRMRNMLEDVYEQDAEAYGRLLELRKRSPSIERDGLMERAWKTATIIPGAMGRAAMISLRLAGDLAPKAPPAARPDVAAAAWLCYAAVQASLIIVHRNLTHISDMAFREKFVRNLSFLDDRDRVLKSVLKATTSEM